MEPELKIEFDELTDKQKEVLAKITDKQLFKFKYNSVKLSSDNQIDQLPNFKGKE